MSHNRRFFAVLFALTAFSFFIFSACDVFNNKDPDSVSSGTFSGSGSSGQPPAHITLAAASESLFSGSTTLLTVTITDAAGRKTEATVILASSLGGTFNGNAMLNGTTQAGILLVDYKAPSVAGEDEITATVPGTALKATKVLTIAASTSSEE